MARVMVDCRTIPSESHCTLTIAGEPDEVVRAAVQHAMDVHGHTDSDELRTGIREAMQEGADLHTQVGAFIQVIDFETDRFDDSDVIFAKWREDIGDDIKAGWSISGKDRDRSNSYVAVVGFASYEDAMANSRHPATQAMSEALAKLATRDSTFRNLDVVRVES